MDAELLRANLLRTFVPLAVGFLCSFLPILRDRGAELTTLVAFGVSWGYYAVIRVAETRYPKLGILLGRRMDRGRPVQTTTAASATPAVRQDDGSVPRSGAGPWDPDADVIVDGRPLRGVTSVAWRVRGGATSVTLELTGVDLNLAMRTPQGPQAASTERHERTTPATVVSQRSERTD